MGFILNWSESNFMLQELTTAISIAVLQSVGLAAPFHGPDQVDVGVAYMS